MRIGGHRPERVDHRGIAEHQCADRWSAPRGGIDRHHIGAHLLDVKEAVRRRGRVIDDHQPTRVVHQSADGTDVDEGAQGARCRAERDQSDVLGEQVLPLPDGDVPGLDVDLGPFHPGAVAIRGPQPGHDVGLVVQASEHHFVAQTRPARGRIGQQGEQDRAVRPEDHPRGIGVEQVGDRCPRSVEQSQTAPRGGMRAGEVGGRPAKRRRHGGGDRLGKNHAALGVHPDPAVAEGGVQAANPGDVECHPTNLLNQPD